MSISVSGGSDGFTIGQCSSCSISGKVLYKYNDMQKNGFITLYRKMPNDTLDIIYQWYITSFTIENEDVINFSGNDIMAFAENSYLNEIPEELKPSLDTDDSIFKTTISIGAQIQTAEKILSRLSGSNITIEMPSSSSKETSYESGWSIRQMLGYAALWQAANYCVEIQDFGKARLTCTNINYISVNKDNYAPLTVGLQGNVIDCVKISRNDNTEPTMRKGQTLEDYYIYTFTGDLEPTPAGTLNIVCPYVDDTAKSNTALKSLVGKSYGAEYQCNSVKLDCILPPFTQINFDGDNRTFYISNASYKLTTMGIYAQVSGDTKSLSDFEFIGTTEKELKSRVSLDTSYGIAKITTSKGLTFRVRV